MKINTGKTRYIVLGLLAHSPQTGYSIKKAIEYQFNHFWQESYGQIYPTLKRLVAEGLAVETADSGNGRGQITYTITDTGKAVLKDWLSETPEIEKLRYEILLKLSFGSSTEPPVILGHLDDFIARINALIKEMEGTIQLLHSLTEQGDDHTYIELTALCGKYTYTAMRDWAQEAKSLIAERMLKNETKGS